MATRRLADIQKDAVESRSRLTINRWDGMLGDVYMRLGVLKPLIGASADTELHRHVVVSLVAALQTYIRGAIISICDLDETYRVRAAGLIPEKLTMANALEWIGGRTATFGELVAHMASCNSTTDIFYWLDGLLGTSVKTELTRVVSEFDQRSKKKDADLLIPDVDGLLATLTKTFQLRHILAHEAASIIRISSKVCAEMWNSVQSLIGGLNAVLWATAYKDLPLTQYEMNVHAGLELGEATSAMESALKDAKATAPEKSAWLEANQAEWCKVIEDWYAHTYRTLDGTMWPSVAAADRAAIVRARQAQIAMWARVLKPDGGASGDVLAKFSNWWDDDAEQAS
jgi:hypothetical protein